MANYQKQIAFAITKSASAWQCLRCGPSLLERIGLEEQCEIPMQDAMAEFEKLVELRSGDPSVAAVIRLVLPANASVIGEIEMNWVWLL